MERDLIERTGDGERFDRELELERDLIERIGDGESWRWRDI